MELVKYSVIDTTVIWIFTTCIHISQKWNDDGSNKKGAFHFGKSHMYFIHSGCEYIHYLMIRLKNTGFDNDNFEKVE